MKQFLLEVLQILFQYVEAYIIFCKEMFKYDMEVFSQGWIYAWCLVPATFYLVFFIIKWIVITLPFWIAFRRVAIINQVSKKSKDVKVK